MRSLFFTDYFLKTMYHKSIKCLYTLSKMYSDSKRVYKLHCHINCDSDMYYVTSSNVMLSSYSTNCYHVQNLYLMREFLHFIIDCI